MIPICNKSNLHFSANFTDIPLTSMRSVIAKRLVQSKQTSPHGHATNECNIDAISKIRKDFMQAGKQIHQIISSIQESQITTDFNISAKSFIFQNFRY